ncbi:CDP-diacylglycerol--glycerol-3-phosphate 3-phosphatidyltransferase [Uliginosibacterium sediminicola]|uniref:CDP-diacylglycerol--glycerol-3-phosphate 3-phosphatidyltransferase n=1 Tax=Uliginosibacterium sediminicola TaxID=2024550 RepID=A0ABU9YZZ0_9RHOO
MFNNVPILLTWARIVLIPVVIGVFYLPESVLSLHHQNIIACVVFVIAAITDWLDGYLARSWQQTSAFGAFLDPVADKLMVSAALVALVQLERCDALFAFVIIGREITISALREWMAKMGAAKSVAVSFIGKLKTAAQMTAIPMLLFADDLFGLPILRSGQVLLFIAAVLTVWSMVYYLRRAAPDLRRGA